MASSSIDVQAQPITAVGSRNKSIPAQIQLPENTGMVMISTPLNGNNWLTWSRYIRIASEGKDKLDFVDGTCLKPAYGSTELKQWRIADSVVRTWILSTISKDIVNAFLYAASARSLWLELEAWYGECNGLLLHKIQREISSISQDNLSVTTYYTKVKQLWDELLCLLPPATCTCGNCICGSDRTKVDQAESSQLTQYLMGLNEAYDNIRSQILVLDPLPTVNKAYSMVLRVERQWLVNLEYADVGNNSPMQVRNYHCRGNTIQKNSGRKRGPIDKRNVICEYATNQDTIKKLVLDYTVLWIGTKN
ncbi:UNVERIFIED_CONTAM: hypothetical protein Sangu_2031200 [Sesamum angustifolium]|uniref:Retrotransposon Copia-like N-terminal domain-containing protein n=1 Tax=Sesamum angustifolium TaxID=2727405 RepID=A0AAW2LHJ9_9LAMI